MYKNFHQSLKCTFKFVMSYHFKTWWWWWWWLWWWWWWWWRWWWWWSVPITRNSEMLFRQICVSLLYLFISPCYCTHLHTRKKLQNCWTFFMTSDTQIGSVDPFTFSYRLKNNNKHTGRRHMYDSVVWVINIQLTKYLSQGMVYRQKLYRNSNVYALCLINVDHISCGLWDN